MNLLDIYVCTINCYIGYIKAIYGALDFAFH